MSITFREGVRSIATRRNPTAISHHVPNSFTMAWSIGQRGGRVTVGVREAPGYRGVL